MSTGGNDDDHNNDSNDDHNDHRDQEFIGHGIYIYNNRYDSNRFRVIPNNIAFRVSWWGFHDM